MIQLRKIFIITSLLKSKNKSGEPDIKAANEYIRSQDNLDTEENLKILYEANRPDPASIDIYYKIVEEGDIRDFDDIPYKLLVPDETDNPDETLDIFREREHSVSGLNAFSTAAIKIEFKSTSTIEVPRIKNLRIIALAV